MSVNQDFKDLFKILREEKVEYLIVGAHAVVFYTQPRYTKDLDIWVNATLENAKKLWKALSKFGAPLTDITLEDFTDPNIIYQIGVEPNRIDILMGICGVEFKDAVNNKIVSTYDGEQIYIISKDDLMKSKQAAARKQDMIDLERLSAEKNKE